MDSASRRALWIAAAAAIGCGAPPSSPQPNGDAAAPATSAQAAREEGSPPGPQDEAALDDLRDSLRSSAKRYEPCRAIGEDVAAVDRLVDAHPRWALAYSVLADALRLGRESCPSAPPVSKHAKSEAEAIQRAMALGGGVDPRAGVCDLERDVAAAEALREQKAWAGAVSACRKVLSDPCRDGAIHWQGRRHGLIARARLGLSEAALESGDPFEARRQLRWLDFDRREAVLRTGDEAREAALWQRLGAARPRPYRAADPAAAVAELERAAIEDDAAAFLSALSARAPDRALLSGAASDRYCAKYAVDSPARLRMCIATSLLPEAPVIGGCEAHGNEKRCRVVGRDKDDERVVALSFESGDYRVVDRVDGP